MCCKQENKQPPQLLHNDVHKSSHPKLSRQTACITDIEHIVICFYKRLPQDP